MRFEYNELKWTDRVTSILGTVVSAVCAVIGTFFKPEYFNWYIFVAVLILAVTIVFLFIKLRIHSKRISALELRSIEQENIIEEQNRKISFMERMARIPFFLDKWHLYYTFIWRNSISQLQNNVHFYRVHVKRFLSGKGKLKDNSVTYTFCGKCEGLANKFRLCIAGLNNIPLKSIGLIVKELRNGENLDYKLLPNMADNDIKFLEIYFKTNKGAGDLFEIEVSWKWPKTAYIDSDYFSYPNIYSNTTDEIILELHPAVDMSIKYVETYEFTLEDSAPKLIDHVYINQQGTFISNVSNPKHNADYITYYE